MREFCATVLPPLLGISLLLLFMTADSSTPGDPGLIAQFAGAMIVISFIAVICYAGTN